MALVATSGPPEYGYEFSTVLELPIVELTSAVPIVRYRLQARALGLAPNEAPTTAAATARFTGLITAEGVALEGSAPFVNVRLRPTASAPDDAGLLALTQFDLPATLVFEGDCARLIADPCEGELSLEFHRQDEGENGGTLRITSQIELNARVSKGENKPDEGPFELPWDIQVISQ